MRSFAGFAFLVFFLAVHPLQGSARTIKANNVQQPVVRAVLFWADWCPNCHVLEPILIDAMAKTAGMPVELVVLDFTNAETWDASVETALEHNVVQVYNAYAGTTGMVVLTSADTGERIGCFNRTFTAPAMVHAMRQAVATARSAPPGRRNQNSAFCPPGRAPL